MKIKNSCFCDTDVCIYFIEGGFCGEEGKSDDRMGDEEIKQGCDSYEGYFKG